MKTKEQNVSETAVVEQKQTSEQNAAVAQLPEGTQAEHEGDAQPTLFPDEIKEETEVREVLIPLKPHEVLEAVDRIVALNKEVNEGEQELEREKQSHKEEKDKVTANIDAARQKLSKLIEVTGMKKRREVTKTRKVINFSTKRVQWFVEGVDEPVEERDMVAAEHQVKLALPESEQGDEDTFPAEGETAAEGDAGGVDPATFDEAASEGEQHQEGA